MQGVLYQRRAAKLNVNAMHGALLQGPARVLLALLLAAAIALGSAADADPTAGEAAARDTGPGGLSAAAAGAAAGAAGAVTGAANTVAGAAAGAANKVAGAAGGAVNAAAGALGGAAAADAKTLPAKTGAELERAVEANVEAQDYQEETTPVRAQARPAPFSTCFPHCTQHNPHSACTQPARCSTCAWRSIVCWGGHTSHTQHSG